MTYYSAKSEFVPLGKLQLDGYTVRLATYYNKNCIELHHRTNRNYYLYAKHEETMKNWVVELYNVIAVEKEVIKYFGVSLKPLTDDQSEWEMM